MYGYIYKTTNLINGKIYIGKKVSEKFVESYYGSGVRLQSAMKKYGWKNFSVEILEWCSSKEELCSKECEYISLYNSNDRNIGYNLTSGGEGGDTFSFRSDDEKQITKEKISKANKGRPTWNSPYFIKKEEKQNVRRKHKEDMTLEERISHGIKVKEGIAKMDPEKRELANKRKSKAMLNRTKGEDFQKFIKEHNKNNKWGSNHYHCIIKNTNERLDFNSSEDAINWWIGSGLLDGYPYIENKIKNKGSIKYLIDKSIKTGHIFYTQKGGNHKMYEIDNIIWFSDGRGNSWLEKEIE